ncbi:MAG: peptidoglycan-binding domain-containing protein [Ilumatobacteraceae bacterium]
MPGTVQLGSTGHNVERLQRVMARSMIISPFGPITGVFDAALDTAVRSYQSAEGLVVDGIVGPVTWSHLPPYREASPRLQIGSTGPGVAWLQQVLAGSAIAPDWTVYTGPIDGIFGALTDASVRSLQGVKGVTVDGIVGDQTWFAWLTPGTMQQLTLEAACGFLERIFP